MADRLVQMPGFVELQATLRRLGDAGLSRQVKAAGAAAARDVIIPAARSRASTRLERRAAETLRASTAGGGGAVRFGAGFPGAFGAEFGAYRNQVRRRATGSYRGLNQFRPWRGSDADAGYFLWPSIRDKTPEVLAAFGDAIEDIFRGDT